MKAIVYRFLAIALAASFGAFIGFLGGVQTGWSLGFEDGVRENYGRLQYCVTLDHGLRSCVSFDQLREIVKARVR